jgi:hypothetical protein
MDLPAHKRELYRSEVQKALQSRGEGFAFNRKELECLVGKLICASKVTPWGYLHNQHLFDAVYPVTTDHATKSKIPWTQGALSDLEFWDKALALEWQESVGTHESMLARKDGRVESKP